MSRSFFLAAADAIGAVSVGVLDAPGEVLSEDEIVSVVGPPAAVTVAVPETPVPVAPLTPLPAAPVSATPAPADLLEYHAPHGRLLVLERWVTLVQAIFWVGTLACVAWGCLIVINHVMPRVDGETVALGVGLAVLAPLLLRGVSGVVVALLRVHQELVQLRERLEQLEGRITGPPSTSAPSPSVPVSPGR